MGVQVSFSNWHSDIGFPNNIKKLSGIVKIWSSELHVAFEMSNHFRPVFEMKWKPRSFCRVSPGESDILSSCDMNDEHAWRFCREIWTSVKSGHLRAHFAWRIKHRVPLTYIFLRENSSWGACGKIAYLFCRRQGISSHLQTIWVDWIFHPVALLKWMFL